MQFTRTIFLRDRHGASGAELRAPALTLLALLTLGACQSREEPQATVSECVDADPGVHGIERVLRDAIDLDVLARLDDVPYTSRLVSSYDRRSVLSGTPDWFTNHDADGREGLDPDGTVLFDEQGPGVITRIWSANPQGRVRFYFDDEPLPRWDFPLADLLDGLTPVARDVYVSGVGGGATSMLPIPFAGRLRITADVPSYYYQIDHRLYAPGTDVGAPRLGSEITGCRADRFAEVLRGERPRASTPATHVARISAQAPASLAITAPAGGAQITELRMKLRPRTDQDLEQTILRIVVDGERTIFVPIGRFFLFDPHGDAVSALPVEANPDTGEVVSRFRMPFLERLVIDLVAPPGTSLEADVAAVVEPKLVDARDLRFHARWTGPYVVDTAIRQDLRFVSVTGAGKYVGTALRVGNPERAWWGEGDEKVWVDDDTFPSRFGTGTEDYFGFAWCSTGRFSTPWIGQYRANFTSFAGITSLYRFHLADATGFDSFAAFDQEVYHWDADFAAHHLMDVDAVVYLYLAPGAEAVTNWNEMVPHAAMSVPEAVIEFDGSGRVDCGHR